MAYNEELTNRIREALVDVANVEEKRMFRGVAFMVDGKMCITAGDDTIMCRIDPVLHDKSVERNGCSGVIMRGRSYRGYVHVNQEGMRSKEDFDYWIGLALDYNPRAKASSKRRRVDF